jgi:hypothetical protein
VYKCCVFDEANLTSTCRFSVQFDKSRKACDNVKKYDDNEKRIDNSIWNISEANFCLEHNGESCHNEEQESSQRGPLTLEEIADKWAEFDKIKRRDKLRFNVHAEVEKQTFAWNNHAKKNFLRKHDTNLVLAMDQQYACQVLTLEVCGTIIAISEIFKWFPLISLNCPKYLVEPDYTHSSSETKREFCEIKELIKQRLDGTRQYLYGDKYKRICALYNKTNLIQKERISQVAKDLEINGTLIELEDVFAEDANLAKIAFKSTKSCNHPKRTNFISFVDNIEDTY